VTSASNGGRVGGQRGFLRYPVTDETCTADGIGRFNHFEGGKIEWSPGGGARATRMVSIDDA
jgi:uncharacterized protein with LGFP repeats